jgi:acetylornithine aminotransferase
MTGPLVERWDDALLPNYGTPGLGLVRGSGATVTDESGRDYLDLYAGIAVNALGHAHPAVVSAVSRQVATLGHVSNFYATGPAVALAERLLRLADRPGAVFLCNSGTEATEAAFKLSRRTGRTGLVATADGFHGRTMGALALTGQPAKREPFQPLPGDVTHVPFGDVSALDAAVDGGTAMVILEPVQGEAGAVVPPAGYLAAAREITERHGALLVVDEVQTGVGRTGHWFAHQADGVRPDAITLAKGLGGGLPVGALMVFDDTALSTGDRPWPGDAATGGVPQPLSRLLGPGSHGTTFGGNPVCCAAALAVLDTIADDHLLDHVKRIGERLRHGIEALGHPLVSSVRGAGLLIGVVLAAPVAARVAAAARDAGFLINPAQPDVIRLAPPLILTADQVDAFLAALPAALSAAGSAVESSGGGA